MSLAVLDKISLQKSNHIDKKQGTKNIFYKNTYSKYVLLLTLVSYKYHIYKD